MPELEGRWYTTVGNQPRRRPHAESRRLSAGAGQQSFNRCGVAKWSCVTAPANNINSTTVQVVGGVPMARYGSSSGTSMAGPHSAAALSLIMKRFPYMTNTQALYTMFTTGRQNNTISDDAGAADSEPRSRPDGPGAGLAQRLEHGEPARSVQGPGQLLGPTHIDTDGYSDAWSNDISDVAIRARQQEDVAEAAAWQATKVAKGWTNGLPPDASDIDKSDFAIGTRREEARNARVYAGSLSKRGHGTLFLTGNNSWQGRTTVLGGKLSVIGTQTGRIDVYNGTLGGSGSVAGGINVVHGSLKPGLSVEEAGRITDVAVVPGNVLSSAGTVRIGDRGRLLITIRGDTDYTAVVTTGPVFLDGDLDLDVQGQLTKGAVLTILTGSKIVGKFDHSKKGHELHAGGHKFKISYRSTHVTLTASRFKDHHEHGHGHDDDDDDVTEIKALKRLLTGSFSLLMLAALSAHAEPLLTVVGFAQGAYDDRASSEIVVKVTRVDQDPATQSQPFEVDVTLSGGTAVQDVDYRLGFNGALRGLGRITLPPGVSELSFSVHTLKSAGADKTLLIGLSNPTGPAPVVTGENPVAQITILNAPR